jgi:polysaccharide biosynthesis transport protein
VAQETVTKNGNTLNTDLPSQTVDLERPGEQIPSMDLMSIIRGLLGHWKLITAFPLVMLVVTYGVLRMLPSNYRSTTEILVFDPQREMDETLKKHVSSFVNAVDNAAMTTEIEVIKSKSVALRVTEKLGLNSDPEFQSRPRLVVWAERLGLPFNMGWSDRSPQSLGDPDTASSQRLDRAADALLEKVQVERVAFSYILTISATSQDPMKAQRIAETWADEYLASEREARQDALQRVAAWLKGRVDDLQSRVLETEASIEKLKTESGLTETGNAVSDQQIAQLNVQLMAARGEVADKRAQLEQARRVIDSNGDIKAIPELMASSVISPLRQQQAELIWREAELRNRLGDRHAEVEAARTRLAGINRQISLEAGHILDKMKNAYDISVRHEESLETSLQSLTAARGNTTDSMKLQQLRRVADADRKLYESYLSQYNEVSQRRTLQDASARVIAHAAIPGSPSSPRRVLWYGLSGIFGLGSGLLLAFLLQYLHTGLKTSAQVEQTFGYPVVGIIPLLRDQNSRPIVRDRLWHKMVASPLSHLSEAVSAMRIGLELSNSDSPPRVILVTSSIPGEGKSAAAMLLAASSATSGHRTMLLDCDLRQQAISRTLGENLPGLSEVLRGTIELADVIRKDPRTGIYVIPAGSMEANPADLLMSQRMRDVIMQLRDQYDYVVMDSSPLLPVIDALGLTTMVDKILIIVEWSRTPRVTVSEAVKMLRPEASRIAGVVLNKVELKQLPGYAYAGGYYNGYHMTRDA